MGKYLALDYGEKRIGLAISDITRTLARPYKTLPAKQLANLVQELKKIIQEEHVEKVIVGLPITMTGGDSRKTQEVRKFVAALQKALPVPVETEDERLTTVQAHATFHAMGKKPSKHRDRIDQYAAMHLLQPILDREKQQQQKES